ncbi:hypothetical protein BQ8794_70031 [Mesorhizobium prunaredense]|uniref:Uncharacterized protein n=1 Tax=Mesorhizobium prunaredense TaxID=1631249 RepID=A0A1R3VGY7_9HYPH|nr:hypothetical protein BQ8794_70031 [Mesorhizobium prunaredense]
MREAVLVFVVDDCQVLGDYLSDWQRHYATGNGSPGRPRRDRRCQESAVHDQTVAGPRATDP